MNSKWLIFSFMFLLVSLIAACLFAIARNGRDTRRFRERQQLRDDLYRFTVTIVCSMALYLLGRDLHLLRILPLPDGVLLFVTTALPTWLLCSLSGRWYLGCTATLIVQGLILLQIQTKYVETLHSTFIALLLQNALFDLAGLGLYAWMKALWRKTAAETEQARHLQRYLSAQKAGHVK